jgi:hypothetical protein
MLIEHAWRGILPRSSDAYLLSRIRLSADLPASRYFRVFAEAKSSRATRRDLSGGDNASFVDALDLQNGFADVVIPLRAKATLTVRGGRQELLFGSQRLVGPSDWSNVRRTFQGVSGNIRASSWEVTPFWTELVVFLNAIEMRAAGAPDHLCGSHPLTARQRLRAA